MDYLVLVLVLVFVLEHGTAGTAGTAGGWRQVATGIDRYRQVATGSMTIAEWCSSVARTFLSARARSRGRKRGQVRALKTACARSAPRGVTVPAVLYKYWVSGW